MMNEESLQVKEGLKGAKRHIKRLSLISRAMDEVNQKVVEVSASVEQMTAVSQSNFRIARLSKRGYCRKELP